MEQEINASQKFFTDQINIQVISEFRNKLERSSALRNLTPKVVEPLLLIVKQMLKSGVHFDRYCQSNIEWIGDQFISGLKSFNESSEEENTKSLTTIFTSAYRFLCEYEFSYAGELGVGLRSVKSFVYEKSSDFSGLDRSQLIFAEYMMPAHVLKNIANSPLLSEFKSFSSRADAAAKLKEEWDKELADKENRLSALKDTIKNLTSEYNFVAISKGFLGVLGKKEKEKSAVFVAMMALGAAMLLPVLGQVIFVALNLKTIESHKATLVYALPFVLTMEIILFYFFRVVLMHYNSLKAQILQLELRVSLCQFIESYAEYSVKIKENDGSVLEKFEQLIFSGIVASDADIPSTFDGMEQVSKIIANIRTR